MPKLEYLLKNMQGIQTDLDEAAETKSNMDSMLEKRFAEVNKNIEGALKDLIRQASDGQTAAFSSAVQQAMLQLTQTQQILMNSLAKISTAPDDAKKEIIAAMDKAVAKNSKENDGISKQIATATNTISKAITSIPEPPKTDLSGLSKQMKALSKQIADVPETIIPEQKDFTGSFKSLEKMIKNRTHTFEIERDPFNDLIKTIKVVTE